MVVQYLKTLVSFMRNVINPCGNKLQFTVETMANESLVTRARNNPIAKGMATDSNHLMFVDADIGFDFTDVVKMLIADKDVIGGLYPKKDLPYKICCKLFRRTRATTVLAYKK